MARPMRARQQRCARLTTPAAGLFRGLASPVDPLMALSKDDVLAALGKISSPDGVPLPATGKLSEIIVADGKVFFSITVDSAAVQQWESVRERAQQAIRALPGVQSVMAALTAERAGGAAPRPQAPPVGRARPGGPPGGPAAPGPQAPPVGRARPGGP